MIQGRELNGILKQGKQIANIWTTMGSTRQQQSGTKLLKMFVKGAIQSEARVITAQLKREEVKKISIYQLYMQFPA